MVEVFDVFMVLLALNVRLHSLLELPLLFLELPTDLTVDFDQIRHLPSRC